MTRKTLPRARELWKDVPMLALAKDVLSTTRKGVYTFRLSKGIDVYGDDIYYIEVMNILGFLDEFCELFTDDFPTEREARDFLKTCHSEAERIYRRLKRKQLKRFRGELEE